MGPYVSIPFSLISDWTVCFCGCSLRRNSTGDQGQQRSEAGPVSEEEQVGAMTGGVGLLEICGKQLQSPCVQSVSPVPADLHVV